MLATQFANFFKKMISFGNAASSQSGLVPLKTAYKKEKGNCSGRSRVRRILLTCIQLLLIQFLDVIWSMPKSFAFFQIPLNKFFYKFDNAEINRQEIFPASFKNIENREGF